jgi:hypothetical protein
MADSTGTSSPKTGTLSQDFMPPQGGGSAKYTVSTDPKTYQTQVFTTVDPDTGKQGTANLPVYFYVDDKGFAKAYTTPEGAVQRYLKDINANGTRSAISKQLYNNKYINQKQYTSNNSAAFISGLTRYVMDFGVDQATNMSAGQQNDFIPFSQWTKSAAGQSGSIGTTGSVSDYTVNAQLTSAAQASFQIDSYFFDAIGRKATKEEKAEYLKEINTAEKQAAIRVQTQSTTVTGPDSTATSRSTMNTGAGGLTQQDLDHIQAGLLAPVIEKMSTAEILKTNGSVAKLIINLQNYAADYSLPAYSADVAKRDIVSKIRAGNITPTAAEDPEKLAIRTMAKAYYPNLSNQIDQGVKVSSIAGSLASHMEKTLELTPGSINLNDKYITKALQNKDVNGKPQDGVMNIHDFEKQLRADPRWAKTTGAKEEASSYVNTILSSFGLVK